MRRWTMQLSLAVLMAVPTACAGKPGLGRQVIDGVLEGGERAWNKRQAEKAATPSAQAVIVNSGIYVADSQNVNVANDGSSVVALHVVRCDGELYDISRMPTDDLSRLEQRIKEIHADNQQQLTQLRAMQAKSRFQSERQVALETQLSETREDLGKIAAILHRHMMKQ